tara:strand:+ start:4569 stop:4988 length:420 start_codon:yes stop_codon:yes gene_type:complete
MFEFLKKKDTTNIHDKNKTFIEVGCLLIHAARIDQNFTEKEEQIVEKTLLELGAEISDVKSIINEADKIEKDSNQILDFTKNLKNETEETKILIVEALWKIIYSDSQSDMYESNLMRRLTGLLYLNPKIVGDIKEKAKK